MADSTVTPDMLRRFSPLDGLKRENVAALAKKMEVRTLDSSKPLLLLLDLCQAGNVLSADMMFSARSASHARTDVSGKTAVIVLGNSPAQGIQMLLDRALASTRERKLFDNETDGVAWLLET